MCANSIMSRPRLMLLALICLAAKWSTAAGSKRNYDARYTNLNIPQWKQRACEKPKQNKASSHYICDDKGDFKCLPGWQGDLCQVPMCRRGCDPMNGYCQRPGECRCHIGYTGEHCDKCMTLPGCQHGYCNKPFECICKPGWDGLFCTEPTCRQGCHSTRGYCEAPGECRCRIGWAGRTCSECSVLPGCQHGTCKKPLDCQCLPGYTGLLCQTAICAPDCNKQHGYCRKPGECRCKVGWQGPRCDECHPYPGCVNGDCEQPWECSCRPGWGGMLCDEQLTFCEKNPNTCENDSRCISLTKEDGQYRCHCRQGYLGKNCEIVDEFLMTSTAAPRITPPHGNDYNYEITRATTNKIPTTTQKTFTKVMPTATNKTGLLFGTTAATTIATSVGSYMSTTTTKTPAVPTAVPEIGIDSLLKREGVAETTKTQTATTTPATTPTVTKATHVLSLLKTNGAHKKLTPDTLSSTRSPGKPLIFPTMATIVKNKTETTTTIKPMATTKNVTLITATQQPNKVNLTKLTTSAVTSASGLVGNAMQLNEPNEPNRKGVNNEITNVVAGADFKPEVNEEEYDEDDDDDDNDEGDEEDEDEDDEEDEDDQFIPNIFDNEARK